MLVHPRDEILPALLCLSVRHREERHYIDADIDHNGSRYRGAGILAFPDFLAGFSREWPVSNWDRTFGNRILWTPCGRGANFQASQPQD